MEGAEFDQFAQEYEAHHRANIAITGEDPAFFSAYKVAFLRSRMVNRVPHRILDFGSGIGNAIPFFRRYFPDSALTCADVSDRSLAMSRGRFPGREEYALIEGRRLPFGDETFDVVFSAGVFHHIDHAEHNHWLEEALRVARPGGHLAIFEHNPLNPLTVRAVRTCAFDENARLIKAREFRRIVGAAGWSDPTVRYHVFFPRALHWLRRLEPGLGRLPLGAQYSVIATRAA